jgi:L-fuconolactonase
LGELAFDRGRQADRLKRSIGDGVGSKAVRIDSHQHFWRYDPAEYGWMKEDWPIRRDYLPADLQAELATRRVEGCIAVQARQTVAETRWLLELAERAPFVLGVVGWVDLQADDVLDQLAEWSQHRRLVGVRHVIQDEPDNDFMLGSAFTRGIGHLRKFGLTYDILVYPRQLAAANKLVRQFPEQPFVLDHLGKPNIREGEMGDWKGQIVELARMPNVWCKVSGMVTEAAWKEWSVSEFRPYLDIIFEAFGADRLMFGSDWPVALLSGSYQEVFDLVHDYVAALGPSVQDAVFGGNAERFYLRPSSENGLASRSG